MNYKVYCQLLKMEKTITLYKYTEIDVDDDWGLLEIVPANKILIQTEKKVNLPFVKISDAVIEEKEEEEVKEEIKEEKPPIKRLIPKTRKETYGGRRNTFIFK